MSKSRGFTFTLNNYTVDDIKMITEFKCQYIFQEETGESGTKHLQGMLYFTNAVSFNTVKTMLPRAHIEKMKSKIASIKYCSKEDTRTGEIYSNFNYGGEIGTVAQRHSDDSKVVQDTLELLKEKQYREIYGDQQIDYITLKKILINEFGYPEHEAIDKAFKEVYMRL